MAERVADSMIPTAYEEVINVMMFYHPCKPCAYEVFVITSFQVAWH